MKTELITQPNDWSCLACCAAMATHTTLQDVISFMGHDGREEGFSWLEINKYMLIYKVWVKKINSLPNNITGQELFIHVITNGSMGFGHIVYWDGFTIYNPMNPSPGGIVGWGVISLYKISRGK